MCMRQSQVRPYHRWNWHGDEIYHDPVIPASRELPGGRKISGYRIDIREFLSTEGNAVIADEVAAIEKGLSANEAALFHSHQPGAFDFRKGRVVKALQRLRYRRGRGPGDVREFDAWLFPEETLALGGGDCEDLSFVLAALLESSGISMDCIRVAFGALVEHRAGREERHDHAWVMYQNERGAWEILDPFVAVHRPSAKKRAVPSGKSLLAEAESQGDFEYVPAFVMNRRHLWRVRSGMRQPNVVDALRSRTFWRRFDPSFAAGIHDGILDSALGGGQTDLGHDAIASLKRTSLVVDVDVLNYDPRDHFDFAYVPEGWRRLTRRLASKDLRDFALAAHAIADLYAHTVYAEFAPRRPDGTIEPYDPATFVGNGLAYDFSAYAPIPGADRGVGACAALWAGKLISGQWWRWYSTFPDDLQRRKDLPERRCLPDHDLLAVDQPQPKGDPRHRYAGCWQEQFRIRRTAAVEHVRNAYWRWRKNKQPQSGLGSARPRTFSTPANP